MNIPKYGRLMRQEVGVRWFISLVLRCGGGGGERAPGTHCLRMRLIATEFRGDSVRTCMYIYW